MDHLTPEELDEVQRFFTGIGAKFFDYAKGTTMMVWASAQTTHEREDLWYQMQALAVIEGLLRDAKAMNEMSSRRTRERLYEQRTMGV